MNLRPRKPAEPEINLTPLIDVVFLLLIFFMVSTTFDQRSELRIQLPESSNDTPVAEVDEPIEITVDADGNLYLNQEALVNNRVITLVRAIEAYAAGRKDLPVIINADGMAPYQSVIKAMDAAGQAGFSDLTFPTKRVEADDQ